MLLTKLKDALGVVLRLLKPSRWQDYVLIFNNLSFMAEHMLRLEVLILRMGQLFWGASDRINMEVDRCHREVKLDLGAICRSNH